MDRRTLAMLVEGLLSHNTECNVQIDVWYPTIKEIKYILKLADNEIDPNNSKESCTIYDVLFDKFGHNKTPALRVTLFCNEEEAKFMYKYTKQRKEVNK